jgi:hypothetical protein
MDLRHEHQRRVPEIAPELRAIRRLARQVELEVDRLIEFGDDRAWLEAFALFINFEFAQMCISRMNPL